jgi:hypothetical protein
MQNVSNKDQLIRLPLIAGACLCFVIGGKWIAEDIVYSIHDPSWIAFNIVAFIPIIAIGPRYKNRKIYAFVAAGEAFIIIMGNLMTLR